jgi:hypothetical protein
VAEGARHSYRIAIISFRRRRLDDDNLSGGAKALRDAVARWIGIDDGSPRLAWEYHQVIGNGTEQTCVKIDKL